MNKLLAKTKTGLLLLVLMVIAGTASVPAGSLLDTDIAAEAEAALGVPAIPPEYAAAAPGFPAGTAIPAGPGNKADIVFTPPAGISCSAIVFIQVVGDVEVGIYNVATGALIRTQKIDPVAHEGFPGPSIAVGGAFFVIDYIAGEADPYYNGYDAADNTAQGSRNGAPVAATMTDAPGRTNARLNAIGAALGLPAGQEVRTHAQKFETVPFCAASNDTGKFIGQVVKWTFSMTRGNPPGAVALTGFAPAPSAAFLQALTAWDNAMAVFDLPPVFLQQPDIDCAPVPSPIPAGGTDIWDCTVPNYTEQEANDLHLKLDKGLKSIPNLDGWKHFNIDTRGRHTNPNCANPRPGDAQVQLFGKNGGEKKVAAGATTTLRLELCAKANALKVIGTTWTKDSELLSILPGTVGPLFLDTPPYPPGSFKQWRKIDSNATQVARAWQYTYSLKNTGNTAIGPNVDPTSDNHADYYVNEHPTHAGTHHETFNQPGNGVATGFGFDSAGHTPAPGAQETLPPGIESHHYYWEGLGDGAAWTPGQVIVLGFTDPHGPAKDASNGRVKGSGETMPSEPFEDPDQQVFVPAIFVGGIVEIAHDRTQAIPTDPASARHDYAVPIMALAASGVVLIAAGAGYARLQWRRSRRPW